MKETNLQVAIWVLVEFKMGLHHKNINLAFLRDVFHVLKSSLNQKCRTTMFRQKITVESSSFNFSRHVASIFSNSKNDCAENLDELNVLRVQKRNLRYRETH